MAQLSALTRRLSTWGWIVLVSALIVAGGLLLLGTWALASAHERVTTYGVRGSLNEIDLDVGAADARIIGAGNGRAQVRQTERVAFGHQATVRRTAGSGALRIRARCPRTVLHSCSLDYVVRVPDNVPVVVHSRGGDVSFSRYRGSARVLTGTGDIDVRSFCGFSLRARAESGDVRADLACAPEDMALRSATGDVSVVVPPGRYNIDADSNSGRHVVRGLSSAADAPFAIQALSSTGDVLVEARR